MVLKLIAHSGGVAAALAIGLTTMGYIQAAQGLREQAEATLSSDALVVTTSIDDWNSQRLASLATLARLPAIQQTLSGSLETSTCVAASKRWKPREMVPRRWSLSTAAAPSCSAGAPMT